jgi:hypothetical protein
MSFILDTINNSIWVMKLNIYKTLERNYASRLSFIFKFHSILFDVAVLKTMNLPAKNDLGCV